MASIIRRKKKNTHLVIYIFSTPKVSNNVSGYGTMFVQSISLIISVYLFIYSVIVSSTWCLMHDQDEYSSLKKAS